MRILERAWHSISIPNKDKTVVKNPRADFLDLMDDHFSDENLKDLAFELNVDYESLASATKHGRARELFLEMERNGALYKLVGLVQSKRPNVQWPVL